MCVKFDAALLILSGLLDLGEGLGFIKQTAIHFLNRTTHGPISTFIYPLSTSF